MSAHPFDLDNRNQHGMKYTQDIDGISCYFESDDVKTINAAILNGKIEIDMVYQEENTTLHHAELALEEFTNVNFADVEEWNVVIQAAEGRFSAEQNLMIDTTSAVAFFASNSISDLFLDEMESIYGEGNTKRVEGTSRISSSPLLYATITEYYDPYVEYAGQKTSTRNLTVQAFAILLGVAPSVVCQAFGVALSATFPAQTSASLYNCVAYYEKVGTVSGTPYYRAYHEIRHLGVLDPENLHGDIVAMDSNPKHEFYDPSSSIYNSYEKMVECTKTAYEQN